MVRFLPVLYGLLLLAETAALTVVYALWTPAPSDPLSVWLGTLGLLSMVVMLVYSLARRIKLLRDAARLSAWLHLHIFLGLQGFVFVVFHSLPMFGNSRFMWLNPGVVNFLAVCVVIASGVFGRWLFAQVPKTLGGQHMAAKDWDGCAARGAHDGFPLASRLACCPWCLDCIPPGSWWVCRA